MSRGIVLLSLLFQTFNKSQDNQTVSSRINMVDLAGSERQSSAKTSGDRLRVFNIGHVF